MNTLGNVFSLEPLEQRVLLSGEGLPTAPSEAALPAPPAEEIPWDASESVHDVMTNPITQIDDIFDGVESEDAAGSTPPSATGRIHRKPATTPREPLRIRLQAAAAPGIRKPFPCLSS